jgi:hypothetical protein
MFILFMRLISSNKTYLILWKIKSKISKLSDHSKPGIIFHKLQLCLLEIYAITAIVMVKSKVFSLWRIPSHGKKCRPEILRPETSQTPGTSRTSRAVQKHSAFGRCILQYIVCSAYCNEPGNYLIPYGSPSMHQGVHYMKLLTSYR